MELRNVSMVIADISGYTNFVKEHTRSALHAEQIISDLLESVVGAAEFPLAVSKLEGDAAFMYASGPDAAAVARDVTRQVMALFAAFKGRQRALMSETVCQCDACSNLPRLQLKTILHQGEVVFKRIRQFEELGGEATILIHRLLKNSIPSREYVLMTDDFHKLSGGLPAGEFERRVEQAEGFGEVKVVVYYPAGKAPELPAMPEKADPWQRFVRRMTLIFYELSRSLGLRRAPKGSREDHSHHNHHNHSQG